MVAECALAAKINKKESMLAEIQFPVTNDRFIRFALPGKIFQGTSNNSIFSMLATREPLFNKGRSWPKAIVRGALH
jgi:hypothetical protein